jgi:dTMP kinase
VHPAGITGGTAIDTETRETGPVDLSGAAALRSVLRIRPFRRLWLVLGAASFGDWIGLLATGIFAAAQFQSSAGQGAAFGGTIAVRLLPSLVLGPLAGVFADRFDRRYTMVITDLMRSPSPGQRSPRSSARPSR